jgi:hypothetical protein
MIHHSVHGSIASPTIEYYSFRNALIIVRKFGSRRTALSGFASLTVAVARRWARALLRRIPAPRPATRGLLAGSALELKWLVRGSAGKWSQYGIGK